MDWSRFHLQLLFVDVEDMGNARLAQGLFDKTAAWNGYGRSLYAWTCGTRAQRCSPERAVSLMMRAESLGASSKDFSRVPEQLETGDLYTYDLIIAMDANVRDAAMDIFNADLTVRPAACGIPGTYAGTCAKAVAAAPRRVTGGACRRTGTASSIEISTGSGCARCTTSCRTPATSS